MIRVCSGFSPAGRVQYGERFLRAFDRYWPKEVELQVYVEEPTKMPRDAERSLWAIAEALAFADRHRDNKAAQGLVPQPCWKDKERLNGYSFRTDAYKFWKQILIPQAASADMADGDVLIWLDGDVDTTRDVPLDLPYSLLGAAEICYLGRSRGHSEIGFWAVRLNPRTRKFLADIALLYTSDLIFNLPEWHSAYAWDSVRKTMVPPMAERNICPGAQAGHVWPYTKLARYMRHDKGPRKGLVAK
jgi:ADP-ribose pyrophosphatase YjhB (NUDIX family)